MRLATYNVEWFNALFDDHGRLLNDHQWSGRHDVSRAQQIAALTRVFGALDADAVLVVEAPDTNARRRTGPALERFAAHAGLRARKAAMGFVNDTQQELALLFDPDRLSVRHDPRGSVTAGKGEVPRFDGVFRIDLDIDDRADVVRWSKPPVELALTTAAGETLHLIGVHAKSKAPHGATTPKEVMRLSIANRRKQLAQCIWLRARISAHLDAGESLIVAGDFNDGPGLDDYEKLFGRSGVEIVLGGDGELPMFDPHARLALSRRLGAMPTSARFWIHPEGRWLSALLDYIMVSPDLRSRATGWRIWHPFEDPGCYHDPALRDALLTASDHFPVTLDLDDRA